MRNDVSIREGEMAWKLIGEVTKCSETVPALQNWTARQMDCYIVMESHVSSSMVNDGLLV